ncbi:MAG: hypothetical protein QOH50_4047 [Kribbellaceae bacterium]|nr:hypothetical protein [Kribbellaceae bacterium]
MQAQKPEDAHYLRINELVGIDFLADEQRDQIDLGRRDHGTLPIDDTVAGWSDEDLICFQIAVNHSRIRGDHLKHLFGAGPGLNSFDGLDVGQGEPSVCDELLMPSEYALHHTSPGIDRPDIEVRWQLAADRPNLPYQQAAVIDDVGHG